MACRARGSQGGKRGGRRQELRAVLEWLPQDTALFAVSLTVTDSTEPWLDKARELQVVLMSSPPRHLPQQAAAVPLSMCRGAAVALQPSAADVAVAEYVKE